MTIAVIGLGFVGNAMYTVFQSKDIQVIGYDKFKNIGSFESCLESNIMFLNLPTQYDENSGEYNKEAIIETCDYLTESKYKGVIVIKSTVEPQTTDKLSDKFPSLQFIHNPEFLTAKTAVEDFKNQKHIVLGKGKTCSESHFQSVVEFYRMYFPDSVISECSSIESESMKIFCNSFYAVKVQFFTELYLLCQHNNSNYEKIKDMMLKNNWINPMHTTIPGPDGQISYGGLCFPKDTNALNSYMKKYNSDNKVLKACIEERNMMRQDNDNYIKK